MKSNDLMDAGLTKNQAGVYFEVIQRPGQTAGHIAKKLSIDRSFSYGILSSLINKGMISHVIKGKVSTFYPADPENLLKNIDERRDRVAKMVSELKMIKESSREEKSVRVYEGKAGLKAYIRDFLSSESFLTMGGGGKLNIFEALKYEYPHYLKELNKKQIKGRLITSNKNRAELADLYSRSKVDIKSFEGLKGDVSFTIFKDKMAIYSAEEKPFVIIIEDKNIAESLGYYFTELWKCAK